MAWKRERRKLFHDPKAPAYASTTTVPVGWGYLRMGSPVQRAVYEAGDNKPHVTGHALDCTLLDPAVNIQHRRLQSRCWRKPRHLEDLSLVKRLPRQ